MPPSLHRSPRPSSITGRARALAAFVLACVLAGPALAERADRDKPTNIEADSMHYDEGKQLNVFTGNVTLTKGTIEIRADRLDLRQDAAGNQFGTAVGNPATFRQKRDGVNEYITGAAQQLSYDGKNEIVRLEQRASMKRLENDRVLDEVHGNLITYNSRTEVFDVRSGGPKTATPENPTGRVRVVIQPRTENAAPAPSAPVPLAPAQGIGVPQR